MPNKKIEVYLSNKKIGVIWTTNRMYQLQEQCPDLEFKKFKRNDEMEWEECE